MVLPKIIAKVSVPERGKEGDRPYERFRGLVLESINVYQNYTIMRGAYRDETGEVVREDTGHLEHIHAYDKEKGETGQLLASIHREERFGETYYTMDIYDKDFAEFVNEKWGSVEFIVREKKEEIKEKPGKGLLARKR